MNEFASRILTWFDQHGRHDLPWQGRGPYVTWVSEIMLQQTQVTTVIPYFERFMDRFATLEDLGRAEQDEVLTYWSGLGYYARGRNLHKTAQQLTQRGEGLPKTLEGLVDLPGIGLSTAGAIMSMGHGLYGCILDGNVKRVLARHQGETQWPGTTAVQKSLWDVAHQYTPITRSGDYAQAMMDMGATLCTRSKPQCDQCPISDTCVAFNTQQTGSIPASKPKKDKPTKTRWWLIWQDPKMRVYLRQRDNEGLWGALFTPPEADSLDELTDIACQLTDIGPDKLSWRELDPIKHSFSHYHLIARPLLIQAPAPMQVREERSAWVWPESEVATPAPVTQLLKRLVENDQLGLL